MNSSAVMNLVIAKNEDCTLPHYLSGLENATLNPFADRLLKGKLSVINTNLH
jgi:hypothetical protein